MSTFPRIDDTAHCRLPGVDPERFHPEQSDNASTMENTKALCNGGGRIPTCPFRDPCREYSLHNGVSGIWGGWGPTERARARVAKGIVPTPLSMAGLIAQKQPQRAPTQPRADLCALRKCAVCGVEMLPKSFPDHYRNQHGQKAS